MSVWPGRLARAGSGILVLGAVAAVGAAGWFTPVPDDVPLAGAGIPVPAAPTTLVCPAPVVLPESGDEDDPEFDPAPVDSVDRIRFVAGAGAGPRDGESAGTASPGSADPPPGAVLEAWPLDDLAGPPVLTADASGIVADVEPGGGAALVGSRVAVASGEPTTGTVARSQPVAELPPRVAGAVVSAVSAGDLRGITAASCQRPASELWLVGGGTELGTTTLLVVHNPGATPAEIGLEMWGPAGPVELGGGARYVVPSGGEISLRLSALAPELASTVVRVTSAGGQIGAYLQVSELDGFTPGGVDLVVPGLAPTTRQVIGSLVVPESQVDAPGAGLLRLLAPVGTAGGRDAPEGADDRAGSQVPEVTESAEVPVRVSFVGESGPVVLPGAEEVVLVAGEVTDVDLGGLPAGAYAVVVDSEVPVLAGARVERVGTPAEPGDPAPVEQAWIAAGARASAELIAVPAGLAVDAVLTAVPAAPEPSAGDPTGVTRARLTAYDEAGAVLVSEEVTMPAGTTLRVPLPEGTAAVELIPTLAAGTAGMADPGEPSDLDATAESVDGLSAGASFAWGVLVQSQGTDGTLLSVLTPPLHRAAIDEVVVRQSRRMPLE